MNELQIFKENGWEVRSIEKDGNPWFIAKDIAESLGYANPQKAIRDHCKGVNEIDTPTSGGIQSIKIIPEGDLYRLIMRSKLPSAEKFSDWVCEKILPSIRKTGSYKITSGITQKISSEFDATLKVAKVLGLGNNQAALSTNKAIKRVHGIDCMALLGVTHLISEDQVQYFTPSILGKKIDLSAMKINKLIESKGFQTSSRDDKKRLIWTVTEKGKPFCQLLDTNKSHSDGTPVMQIKWSEEVTK